MKARVTVCWLVCVCVCIRYPHTPVCEYIANMYICFMTCIYGPICVYASTSACLFSCVLFCCCFEHILVCAHAQSHQRHWSLRPTRDLSYFYGEVSLASPQTPTVEGEGSRSGWSAVMGAFWTLNNHFSTHAVSVSYFKVYVGLCTSTHPPKLK